MKVRNKTFGITIIALLAACNAVLELTLGNYLHLIKFPLTGIVMVGVNIIIYTAGYSMVPKKGTVISMGFLTALMNLFFGGSFKPWAILAIFLEAGLIEIFFDLMGLSFLSVMTASIVTNVFSLIFTLFTYSVILGKGLIMAIMRIVNTFTANTAVLQTSLILLAGILIVIHIIAGAVFGMIAWKLNPTWILSARGKQCINELGQSS